MSATWRDVVVGSTVRGGDGYEWTIEHIGTPPAGKPLGSIEVRMVRPGREPTTGWPPMGKAVDVLSVPSRGAPAPQGEVRAAVDTLRAGGIAVEIVSCDWCAGDDSAECLCDANCGARGCVNF